MEVNSDHDPFFKNDCVLKYASDIMMQHLIDHNSGIKATEMVGLILDKKKGLIDVVLDSGSGNYNQSIQVLPAFFKIL